jgi:hypothetical protein
VGWFFTLIPTDFDVVRHYLQYVDILKLRVRGGLMVVKIHVDPGQLILIQVLDEATKR